MSAVGSNSGDRELEALRRAQRAHEPSMEEILASIRTIIADEREPTRAAAAPKPAPQRPATPAGGPQIVYSKDAASDAPRDKAPAPEARAPKVVSRQPEPANTDVPVAASKADEEPLLSREAGEAVAAAFGALSANLEARSAEVADGVIREMLRPMLKAWLDEHLPGIVERLVRAEIERVARGPC
jgi:uncharacterized protein